jgi:hypothetical protein
MEPLDHLAGPAADLLGRVDDLLTEAGAPAAHPIWPLLRRVRVLPGEAVAAVVALRPERLTSTASVLRRQRARYDAAAMDLATEVAWHGAAAEAFLARRTALAAHLADGPESMVGRLEASAAYLDALAEWVTAGRAQLARTLADVLVSVEAVALVVGASHNGPGESAVLSRPAAAAEIGARVLTVVAELCDRGDALRRQWAGRLDELYFRPPADLAGRPGGISRIAL